MRFGSLDAGGRAGPEAEVDATVLARRAGHSAALPADPALLARTSYAVKIGAVSDAARPLAMKGGARGL